MRLYHFTPAHLLHGCISNGLSKGSVPHQSRKQRQDGSVCLIYGYQWLTLNNKFTQSWCEGGTLPYDRTEYRLTIVIPKLRQRNVLHWLDVCKTNQMAQELNSMRDAENWVLYKGIVRPQWIVAVDRKT